MSSSSKKFTPLSAFNLLKLVTNHAKGVQTAEKALDASKHSQACKTDLTNISDKLTKYISIKS